MSRLNYHHLHYFWRVATDGNLTRVAQALHVSQSALSAQIRQLEDSMGVQLFGRQGRRLVLTEAGQRVLAYANDIFTRGEELESLLQQGVDSGFQQLNIGVQSTMSRNFIESFVAPLIQRPDVRFTLQSKGLTNLLNGLARHAYDLILTNTAVAPSTGVDEALWQSQLLARQPLAIVGPAQCPATGVFPQGFDQLRWVLPGRSTEIRAAFDGYCAMQQFQPDILAEADDMAMLRLLARDSHCFAVLPTVVVRDEIRQGVLVELMALPNVYENFYALTVRRQFVPPVMNELLATWSAGQPS